MHFKSDDYPVERLDAMTTGELADLRVQIGTVVGHLNLQFVGRRPSVSAPKQHQREHAEWKRKAARTLMDYNTLLARVKGALKRRAAAHDDATRGQRPPRLILLDLLDVLAGFELPDDEELLSIIDEAEASVLNIRMSRLEEATS